MNGVIGFILDLINHSQSNFRKYDALLLLIRLNHLAAKKLFNKLVLQFKELPRLWIAQCLKDDIGTPYALSILEEVAAEGPKLRQCLNWKEGNPHTMRKDCYKLRTIDSIEYSTVLFDRGFVG